ILRYIIKRGSITIDGISLTVIDIDNTGFKVSIIPHTMQQTNLSKKKIGSIVNLETDIIMKYIEKLLLSSNYQTTKLTLTEEFLRDNGF
ncbi:MAG: riboflavin synthase, partial [Brevinema sp.]